MKFKHKSKITFTSLILNLVLVTGFFYLILNAYKFKSYSEPVLVQAYSSNLSVLQEEIPDESDIDVTSIYVDNNLDWVIYYIVKPGDTLSKIATNFWVTVSHIKKVNKLKSNIIKPGQKLTITDQLWIIYESKWENLEQLAKKFNVKVDDILEANGISSKDYQLSKGDEVFIPMSEKQYKKYNNSYNKKNKKAYIAPVNIVYKKGKNIVKKYWYRPNIKNWFYKGHCTRYVAIKKFPYISRNKQKKLWNGNAKYWYKNAAKAWYRVWKTPKVGAIVVIKTWWRRYYYAGHVAIVKKIDRKNKRILVEEMNAIGKYIVTWRWIPMNWKIIGYIYL
jgi:surface antigen